MVNHLLIKSVLIPVRDDLELLQDEEYPAPDEEPLVGLQRLVEPQQVALLHAEHHLSELQQVVLLQHVHLGHDAEQHLDGHEVDEDGALVGRAVPVAVLEGVAQVALGGAEVVVEHVLAAHVVLVRHLLGDGVPMRGYYVKI